MTESVVHRDERTVLVENARFRWAYFVVSCGLLALTTYRSFVWGESPWDLIALVVIGGGWGSARLDDMRSNAYDCSAKESRVLIRA